MSENASVETNQNQLSCPNCNHVIAVSAKECPNCGSKLSKSGIMTYLTIVVVFIIGNAMADTSEFAAFLFVTSISAGLLYRLAKVRFDRYIHITNGELITHRKCEPTIWEELKREIKDSRDEMNET